MSTSGNNPALTLWQQVNNFVWNHRGKLSAIGMIAFSTLVHSLPPMIHSSHGFVVWLYGWFYTFIHDISGGLGHYGNS